MAEKNKFPDLPKEEVKIIGGPEKFDITVSLFEGKLVEIVFELPGKTEKSKPIIKKYKCHFTEVGTPHDLEGHFKNKIRGEVTIYAPRERYWCISRKLEFDIQTRTGKLFVDGHIFRPSLPSG